MSFNRCLQSDLQIPNSVLFLLVHDGFSHLYQWYYEVRCGGLGRTPREMGTKSRVDDFWWGFHFCLVWCPVPISPSVSFCFPEQKSNTTTPTASPTLSLSWEKNALNWYHFSPALCFGSTERCFMPWYHSGTVNDAEKGPCIFPRSARWGGYNDGHCVSRKNQVGHRIPASAERVMPK